MSPACSSAGAVSLSGLGKLLGRQMRIAQGPGGEWSRQVTLPAAIYFRE